MDTFVFPRSPWLGGVIVAALLLLVAAPARAAALPESVPGAGAVFAEGSFSAFITHGNSRDRMVQVCVLCMALALFILMKKFAPDADGGKKRPAGTAPDQSGEDCTRASRSVMPDSSRKV